MNHSVTMQSKQVRGITCTKCMLTLKDSDCNYSLLKNQVINWKWKLPPLHLRLIRQWFNKHVGGRRAWRGTWRVCTPHPTLTSTFWVCNHFTYFFFCVVLTGASRRAVAWLPWQPPGCAEYYCYLLLHNNTSPLVLFQKCVNHI